MTSHMISAITNTGASRRKTRTVARLGVRLAVMAVLGMLVPTTSNSQVRKGCPRFARVPGYGACSNIAGSSCGFCAYRCNDETVVRWNVCGV
jgi:hypothetical protein